MKTGFILLLIIPVLGYSQRVAINADGSAPHTSAMLDIKSATSGFLMPRTSTVTRLAIANPARGLMMYDSIANGVFYYDGAVWQPVSIGKNVWDENGSSIYNTNTGNAGVGTSTPQTRFHVHDATHGYITFSNNTTGATGSNGSFIGAFLNDLYFYNRESAGNTFFYTDALRRVTIDSIGRFGIGLWPEDPFHVRGNARLESLSNAAGVNLSLFGGTSGTNNIYFYRDLTTPVVGGYIRYDPSVDYLAVVNGTGAYFTPTGLGISISAPITKFQVVSGQDAGLGSSTNGYIMLGQSTSTNVIFDNNEIMARNNGVASPLVLQNDGGYVRIGNVAAPAGYIFAVNGKMISEELKVQLSGNWPDYVFQKDYKLKSYDDLRKYISDNNHLPNIPPAAELEKNGMEVGDMQKRMMEKIEELTLYILELETRIKNLEKK